MSEKTEQPTEKKLRDARQKGQVVKSAEIVTALQMAALLGYLMFQGPELMRSLCQIIELVIQVINEPIDSAMAQITGAFLQLSIQLIGGLLIVVSLVTLVASWGQTGPILALESAKPKFDKLNIVNNAKQLVSVKSLFEFGKNLFKVIVLALVLSYQLWQNTNSFQFLPLCGATCGLTVSSTLILWLWSSFLACYLVFGLADYLFQHHSVMKELMMSKEDIKEEYKNSEGNPEMKHKRKEVHRELQSGALAANVKRSSVLVRNPNHLAICLYFQPDETPLPMVIEKGADHMALHMVALAEKAGVPVVENVPLARALYREVECGHPIPESLFEPVATLLRFVMDMEYDEDV